MVNIMNNSKYRLVVIALLNSIYEPAKKEWWLDQALNLSGYLSDIEYKSAQQHAQEILIGIRKGI